jgi:hypothetical protein
MVLKGLPPNGFKHGEGFQMDAKADPGTHANDDNSRANASRPSQGPDTDPGRSEHERSGLGSAGEELAAKAAAAAASLLRQGRTMLAENEELAAATKELSKAVKSNPLGAIAIAFTAGFVLALLARG